MDGTGVALPSVPGESGFEDRTPNESRALWRPIRRRGPRVKREAQRDSHTRLLWFLPERRLLSS